jgi:hypothetical protein
MAMVSGPTPPGTGVIAPAISATSGCTSPTSVDPFVRNDSSRLAFPAKRRANSTGIGDFVHAHVDHGRARLHEVSRVIIPARPMAATRMSARRQTPAKIVGLRVAHRDGGIRVQQQHGRPACPRCRCAPRQLLPGRRQQCRCASGSPLHPRACRAPTPAAASRGTPR